MKIMYDVVLNIVSGEVLKMGSRDLLLIHDEMEDCCGLLLPEVMNEDLSSTLFLDSKCDAAWVHVGNVDDPDAIGRRCGSSTNCDCHNPQTS